VPSGLVGESSGGRTVTAAGTVTIASPFDGAKVSSHFAFVVDGESSDGLSSVSLSVGSRKLKECASTSTADVRLHCEVEVQVADVLDTSAASTLVLTATATNQRGAVVEASVQVSVEPITIKFVRPNDRLPNVRGTSALEVTVDSLLAVDSVQVTVDDRTTPLANWTAAPYLRNDVAWPADVGIGPHKLKAQAKDINGQIASVELVVNVSCGEDADCTDGQRCCVTSGKCNPIVGPGADCDCDHPCPADQGCFPGTCGRGKSKCRPGCYPGANGEGKVRPQYYAERCANLVPEPGQPSVQAYCENLPSDQATEQNRGGACKPANQCDLQGQNCANGRVNPDLPESAQNPVVPYSCMPNVPGVNICVPAGTLSEGALNCNPDSCNSVESACARGLMCVRHVDAEGRLLDDPQCRRQCFVKEDPVTALLGGGSSVCGTGKYCNTGLVGAGYEPIGSGICDDATF
jgi:hypothetical protein